MTGVETEGEAGLIQKMHDVMTPLDHGSEVWVHDRSETALVGDVRDAIQAFEKNAPLVVRDVAGHRVARPTGRRGEHQQFGPSGREPVGLARDRRELLGPAHPVVQHRGDESADKAQAVRIE